MLRERYNKSLDDPKRIAKIRDKMASHIEERNLRANVQSNAAPGCTVEALSVLVEFLVVHADVATGLKSVHDAALLTMMWHTFGRAVDTCFARKHQLSIAASGELFLHIARIKTSVVQGVSLYKAPGRWQQCMLHAFGLLFICYDEPSEYLFPFAPRFAESDLSGNQPYSQEEAVMYWGKLLEEDDVSIEPPQKRERKRPNIASYITEVIRDTLKAMPPSTRQAVTPGMTSHSIRRGAAAYANASPKLAIQWISTRGAWLLESLTNAFAYIGTTTKEDQSVAKVLAGYQAPELPVSSPSIRDLQQRLSVLEYGQLVTLRDELFRHVLGFQDTRCNVALDVVDSTFASLLIYLETVVPATETTSTPAFVSRYQYEFARGIAATNVRLGSSISMRTCYTWGAHLQAHWQTCNHAEVGDVVAGRDTLLSSTLENMLTQPVSINERLGRLEDAQAQLLVPPPGDERTTERLELQPAILVPGVPAPATATSLAGCLLNWYTNQTWQTVRGKKEQNQRAEAKAAVYIMMILYQKPFEIQQEPPRCGAAGLEAHRSWKDSLWTLAVAIDTTANERLHAFDSKKPTRKVSSLRKRWRQLRTSHPDAYGSLAAQYLALKSSGSAVDACTPASHLWSAVDLT